MIIFLFEWTIHLQYINIELKYKPSSEHVMGLFFPVFTDSEQFLQAGHGSFDTCMRCQAHSLIYEPPHAV